jgi:hypothetical protein
LVRSVAGGDGSLIGQSETEIWRHFKEAGALDEGSIERKDRATLMAHISRLETEVFDHYSICRSLLWLLPVIALFWSMLNMLCSSKARFVFCLANCAVWFNVRYTANYFSSLVDG